MHCTGEFNALKRSTQCIETPDSMHWIDQFNALIQPVQCIEMELDKVLDLAREISADCRVFVLRPLSFARNKFRHGFEKLV